MGRIEKTVFISYRRTDDPWGVLIFQDLTQHGYDVFIDYDGIASGNFEAVILENIRARAHFLVLLTPTALERCGDPKDWMRREIEAALDSQRNIVPVMLAGFDFGTSATASQLTGKLAALKEYNGLDIPKGYFSPAMERLRNKFLSVSLDMILHPASDTAQQVAKEQKDKATERADEEERYFEEMEQLADAFIQKEGGDIEKSGKDVRSELTKLESTDLEGIFEVNRFVSLDWYRRGLARCAGVARIGREATRGVGTGFLLMGTALHASLGYELYLLTNSHVVSPGPEISIAISPADAIITFEGLPGAERETWKVKKLIFNSPITELDATLLQLDRPVPGVETYPIAPGLPVRDGLRRVYAVGHPQGGGLSFSLQDNLLLDWDQRLVHYRTPTEPGSSGSPVFDDQWRLIALHHAGRSDLPKLNGKPGRYEASEGINILAIVQEIRRVLSAT